MTFNLDTQENELVLSIKGELDALTANDLRPMLRDLGERQPAKVLLDLSDLRLLDSSGVGAIVSLFKLIRAGDGDLTVIGAQDQPLAIMRLLRLDRVLARKAA